ncbi:hypothetical protein GJAV_G00142920 [Gymnothorax javanicus]|nr:hypothetical protein GJAV_G00142920 [Gymnothorax javanicus]
MKLRTTCFVQPSPNRLSTNVAHSGGDIALHVDIRFTEKMMIMNCCRGGSWGEEAQETYFPFAEGKEYELTITFDRKSFYITVGNDYQTNFPNRMHDEEYNHIFFDGDHRASKISLRPD